MLFVFSWMPYCEFESAKDSVRPSEMPELFRPMKKENGLPRAEASKTGLGVVVGSGPDDDIPLQADSLLHPRTGGMSVSPDDPMFLPAWRRPKKFGGTGKHPVWAISSDRIRDHITYWPDPPNPEGVIDHGLVEPSEPMSEGALQTALAATQEHWREL